jgi:ribosomal protein S18 acetylase RimI-like enzyme
MFVRPRYRGSSTAKLLLDAAEDAAHDAGASRLLLQTGDRQPEAIRFYERNGYQSTPRFEPYRGLSFARCYARELDWRGTRDSPPQASATVMSIASSFEIGRLASSQ